MYPQIKSTGHMNRSHAWLSASSISVSCKECHVHVGPLCHMPHVAVHVSSRTRLMQIMRLAVSSSASCAWMLAASHGVSCSQRAHHVKNLALQMPHAAVQHVHHVGHQQAQSPLETGQLPISRNRSNSPSQSSRQLRPETG